MDPMTQLSALLALASRLASGSSSQATSFLVGALTLMCAKSSDPIATLQISIDSLTTARDICIARTREVVCS
jgi:hypothetical protein